MTYNGFVVNANVRAFEKRKAPNKHYVYIIDVEWDDGTRDTISRRFSAMFDMHMAMLDAFPREGGQEDPSLRIMPFLPGKSLLGNSRIVTEKRLEPITKYCQLLTQLPHHMKASQIVKDFFIPTLDDEKLNRDKPRSQSLTPLKPIDAMGEITGPMELESYVAVADYKADDKTQVNLKAGESVDVVEKNQNGWWLVCTAYGLNGWVPGAYLGKADGSAEEAVAQASRGGGTWHKALESYTANGPDEMSFKLDDVLEVLKKEMDGWWLATLGDKEGWVPGSYLGEAQEQRPRKSLPEIKNLALPTANKRRLPPQRNSIRKTFNPGPRVPRKPRKDSFIEEEEENYVALYPYTATAPDGVSFVPGQKVLMKEQSDGWSFVTVDGVSGWAPTSYLSRADDPGDHSSGTGDQSSGTGEGKHKFGRYNEQSSQQEPQTPPWLRPSKHTDPVKAAKTIEKVFGGIPAANSSPVNRPVPNRPTPASPATAKRPAAKRSIETEAWFKDVTRQVAEAALLREKKEGSFIVRNSRAGGAKNPYSVTLLHDNQIINFHIRRRVGDGRFATGMFTENEKTFSDVREMIDFYQSHTLVIGEDRITLTSAPSFV